MDFALQKGGQRICSVKDDEYQLLPSEDLTGTVR